MPDGPNKVYVGNIPSRMKDDEVKAMFTKFGELAGYHLVTGNDGHSRGFAFFQLKDVTKTERALAELSGMKVHDKTLTAQCVQ